MKKALSIISFCLLGLGTWGVFPVFQLLRLRAQHMAEEAEERLKDHAEFAVFENLTQNPNVVWEEGSHEFWLQGKMYDVGRVITAGKTTFYYCYADEDETALTLDFGGNSKPGNDGICRLMVLLARPFVAGGRIVVDVRNSGIHLTAKPTSGFRHHWICDTVFEIPDPPPRSV